MSLCRFAQTHTIEHVQVDGSDVLSLYCELQKIIKNTRETQKPYFIEVMTYRWKGHVGYREDLDVGVKRKADLTIWKTQKDPIRRLLKTSDYLMCNYTSLLESIHNRIVKAWDIAKKEDYENKNFLLECVYC